MDLLSVKDVSKIIGISEPSVRKHAIRGELRFVRLGKLLRFRPEDVNTFIEGNTSTPLIVAIPTRTSAKLGKKSKGGQNV